MRKRRKNTEDNAQLEMTPMIDVVFQLLIFFIVTLKPEDIIAQLDVTRPAPDSRQQEKPPENMIEIVIGDVIQLNGTILSISSLEKNLARLAKFDTKQTVLVKCTMESRHKLLIDVLNVCSKAELSNISIFTL